MHEYSIIAHLIALCEENAESASAKKINKVFIKVGERSAVEADLLQSAFEVFKVDSAKFALDSAIRRIWGIFKLLIFSLILHHNAKRKSRIFGFASRDFCLCVRNIIRINATNPTALIVNS